MKSCKRIKKSVAFGLAACLGFALIGCGGKGGNGGNNSESASEQPAAPIILTEVEKAKNVILLIGDGMGQAQVKAGNVYKGEKLCMQQFPYYALVNTSSASDLITDSAAAGTALATGTRTTNGVVGKNPDFADLETIVDIAAELGKRTAVITTEELYGATPMAFSGHSNSRSKSAELIESAAATSNVNLFVSYTYDQSYIDAFTENGYTQLSDVDAISKSKKDKIVGAYRIVASAESMSADPESVAFDRVLTEALEYLSQDEDGFFMMAEGAHIDHGGHANNMNYMLSELLAFDDGVRAVLEWAKDRDDTVVIVTADHETGGLVLSPTIEQVKGEELFAMASYDGGFTYEYRFFEWSTTGHSQEEVFCFINGANIDFTQYSLESETEIKNIDVFQIMKDLMTK